ncbi:hypothetical protein [Spiroplasma endosymbiont of Glossina fuscipes fuscipes]|uniref:hypothetical protein n=1 Tax=Spiroplasma endosymbiont of Glossina fuscipes fuscipes TaxID=2004463 RepID=UPI003C761801
MIEMTVKKSSEQGNNHYSFTQTLSFENTIGGKRDQKALNHSIAHSIASLRVQNGFSWEDVNEYIKIKDLSAKEEIDTKDFVSKNKELILAEEKTLDGLVSASHMLTNLDDFFK